LGVLESVLGWARLPYRHIGAARKCQWIYMPPQICCCLFSSSCVSCCTDTVLFP